MMMMEVHFWTSTPSRFKRIVTVVATVMDVVTVNTPDPPTIIRAPRVVMEGRVAMTVSTVLKERPVV